MTQFKCACCGRLFNSKKAKQECCSLACRYKLSSERQKIPLPQRLAKFTNKTETCWLWTGMLDPDGYGRLTDYGGAKPKILLAHRLAYTLHVGPIPEGLGVLHKCDVRNCVNPSHLFLGTNADNNADAVSKGRHIKGAQIWTCKLTAEHVHEIRAKAAQGARQIDLARCYGVDRNTIYRIVTYQARKHA